MTLSLTSVLTVCYFVLISSGKCKDFIITCSLHGVYVYVRMDIICYLLSEHSGLTE